MTIDLAANFGNIITIVGILISALGAWFVLQGKVNKHAEEIKEAHDASQSALEANILLQNRLSQIELQMLREFVSVASMRDLEMRITTSISEVRQDISKLTQILIDKK